jgi:hypothetical protein
MNNGATPDGSTVVGLNTDMMTGLTHGFMIKNGNLEPFDVPGSNLTQAWDINPKGHVVSSFRDGAGKTHGFLRTDGEYAEIAFLAPSQQPPARSILRAKSSVGTSTLQARRMDFYADV